MGHVWLGFAADQLASWTDAAGLATYGVRALPADPAAKGPALFAATATDDDTIDPDSTRFTRSDMTMPSPPQRTPSTPPARPAASPTRSPTSASPSRAARRSASPSTRCPA